MPSLTAGQTVEITVPAGGVAFLSDGCSGYATITSGSNNGQRLSIGNTNDSIGPYGESITVQLTCSVGTLSYFQVPPIVVGTSAPNNSDGMPDGTVYIQG